ncbi:MAG: beta-glucosidase, partial [Coleofasciculaceae cyanobacterium]
VAKPRELGYQLQLIDRHTPLTPEQVGEVVATQPTLLQLFIRGNPFRGSVGLTPLAENLIKKLLRNGNLQALIIYGSPYVLEKFLPYLPSDLPYVFSYGQMSEAQEIALKVLFGQTLPVSSFVQFI